MSKRKHAIEAFFQTGVGGLNMAPGVSWSAGPAGTQSYVLFMEGEGGARIDPTVHWIVYNIPATASRLPTGISKDVHIRDPAGALNGREDSSVFQGRSMAKSAIAAPISPPTVVGRIPIPSRSSLSTPSSISIRPGPNARR